MHCTACGAKNPDDYRFCYKCGKPRPEMAPSAQPDEAKLTDERLEACRDEIGDQLTLRLAQALRDGEIAQEEVPAIGSYILDHIDEAATDEELLDFLGKLHQKWSIFEDVLALAAFQVGISRYFDEHRDEVLESIRIIKEERPEIAPSAVVKAEERDESSRKFQQIRQEIKALENAATTKVDDNVMKQAKKILSILEDSPALAELFQTTLSLYETAIAASEFFMVERWLSKDGKSSNFPVLQDDYLLYLDDGIDRLLTKCPLIDQGARDRLLELRGLRHWLERTLVKRMVLYLSLERRLLNEAELMIICSPIRLGREAALQVIDEVTEILKVVK